MENVTQLWIFGSFIPNDIFFRFSKIAGKASSLLPSCAPVSVAEYA